jgi:hypothetical protein
MLLQVARKLQTEYRITLVILSFSEISLHVATLADDADDHALDVHLQVVFQGQLATAAAALERVNKVMACPSQVSYHQAFLDEYGKAVFSKHATTNSQFTLHHVHGPGGVGFDPAVFGDVRMAHGLPLDSLFYDAGPYLPPNKIAALVAPYFEHLPAETRAALSLLPHYQAAFSPTAGASSAEAISV